MSWFERLTGFPETQYRETQARLHVRNGRLYSDATDRSYSVGSLELVSLADLRKRAREVVVPGKLQLGIIEGNIRRLHTEPKNVGAVFQVASQFNLLEMISPCVTPEDGVARYERDLTQGPACAIAAGAGAIYRNYFVPVGSQVGQTAERQLDALADFRAELARQTGVAPDALWRMRNGYVLPNRNRLNAIETYIRSISEADRDLLRGLVRVGLHRDVEVTEPGVAPGALVTQVYCSALPIGYSDIAAPAWRNFATIVLEAAYEATLLAGVLYAAHGETRRVLLTRIGGGVFGNDDLWINAAILRALRLQGRHGLEALMVSHGPPSLAMRSVEAAWREADAD